MNNIEQSIFDSMENKRFQHIVHDDLSFADRIIDQRDLDNLADRKDDNKDDN